MAETPAPGNAITEAVVEVDGQRVVVGITDYSTAYALRDGNPLYDYLSGGKGYMLLTDVASGRKFMTITDYSTAYARHGSVAEAVANAPSLTRDQIRNYKQFKGFDGQGQAILVPIFWIVHEELGEKIAEVESLKQSDYSIASWAYLDSVLSEARDVYHDPFITDSVFIQETLFSLVGAVNALLKSKALAEEKFYSIVQDDYKYDQAALIRFRINEGGDDEIIALFLSTDVSVILELAESLFVTVLPEAGVRSVIIDGKTFEITESSIANIAKAVLDALEASPSDPNSFHGSSLNFGSIIHYEGYEILDKNFTAYFYVADIFYQQVVEAMALLPSVEDVTLQDKELIATTRELLESIAEIHELLEAELLDHMETIAALEERIAELEADAEQAKNDANAFRLKYAALLAIEVEDILIADKDVIDNALEDFGALSELAQSLLTEEKALLDSFRTG